MQKSFTITLVCAIAAMGTAAQDGEGYLRTSLPQEWAADGEFFEQSMPADDLWWRNFGDTTLDSLINIAVTRNFQVLGAIENIKRAKAQWRQAQGNLYPTVDLSAGWQRAKSSGNTAQTLYRESWDGYFSGGASVSWQVDIFGSIYMRAKAQKRLFQATEEEYRAVMTTLCAGVATNWFSLRESLARLEVLRSNVESQKEIMNIVTSRYNSGLASKLDVAQSRSVYYNTRAQIPAMQATIDGYRNTLATLLGCYPSQLTALTAPTTLPSYIEPLALGVPGNLLRRRPDIRQAEKEIEAYAAALGASKRDWLPSFYLTGSIGYAADKPKELPHSRSLTWEIAPTIKWNIFNGGKSTNATREARAALEQSIISFNSNVLTAMQEVETAMSNYKNSITEIVSIKEAVNQSSETLTLSLELYKQGLAQFQSVLDAQRTLLNYQDSLVQAQGASLIYLVQLYEALGGGW